jgi:hypothetical protein
LLPQFILTIRVFTAQDARKSVVKLLMVGRELRARWPGRQVSDPPQRLLDSVEVTMGLANWLVCGGVWMVCAFCALLFVRGAGLANERSAALEEEYERYGAQPVPVPVRAMHASRSSLPRSAN